MSVGRRDSSRAAAPVVSLAAWPFGKRFGLFLSHDVDQIYDREFFKVLGDINHLRRVLLGKERGNLRLGAARLGRALFRPKPTGRDVDRILSIERHHGVRSTFFFLEDRTFNRYGGRYRYGDAAARTIARRVADAGCELAVHGAFHALDNAVAYRAQRASFTQAFSCEPRGIRNHFLLHNGVPTWEAQRRAGYSYDATFGSVDSVGIVDGQAQPFAPLAHAADFVALPLTVMDSALFREMRLSHQRAMARSQEVVSQVLSAAGLLTLSWHNNYFAEPEYADWERAYDDILGWLADRGAWCATGEELAAWWTARARVQLHTRQDGVGAWVVDLESDAAIDGLTVDANVSPDVLHGPNDAVIERCGDGIRVQFPRFGGAARIRIER